MITGKRKSEKFLGAWRMPSDQDTSIAADFHEKVMVSVMKKFDVEAQILKW